MQEITIPSLAVRLSDSFSLPYSLSLSVCLSPIVSLFLVSLSLYASLSLHLSLLLPPYGFRLFVHVCMNAC